MTENFKLPHGEKKKLCDKGEPAWRSLVDLVLDRNKSGGLLKLFISFLVLI